MVRWTERQRSALGITIRELANYGAAALLFGQFVGNQVVSWPIVLAGIGTWFTFVSFALMIEGDR
jgi:hypothetical protein